jgi:hypothetical protein
MKKGYSLLSILFFTANTFAQNVGIGTQTPTTTLEIKKELKSTLKISSNDFRDTSQLIFSNKTPGNLGTEMSITNISEEGIRFSSKSDLTQNNKDTILHITPDGNIGIRTATPQYPLDVKGNMNVSGELRVNGLSGAEGQFLRSNGNGTMSWAGAVNSERFKNFRVYRTGSSGTSTAHVFTFPSGITEIGVEIWGGGGKGDAPNLSKAYYTGGKSGAYIYAIIPVGTSTSINLNVGSGGGCFTCGTTPTEGKASSVVLSGLLTLTAQGAYDNGFTFQAGYSATGSYLPNVSYFGVEGATSNWAEFIYQNSPAGYEVFHRNSNGADAPFRPGTGGKGGYMRNAWGSTSSASVSAINGFPGSEPGGGGGFPNGIGGNGQIIVYW